MGTPHFNLKRIPLENLQADMGQTAHLLTELFITEALVMRFTPALDQ